MFDFINDSNSSEPGTLEARLAAKRAALLESLPLHAALLAPGAPGSPAADPFADGAPPLDPAHFSGPGGFTAMHAAALAAAPTAIAKLKAAGCPVDSRLADDAEFNHRLALLLSAVPPGPAKYAAGAAGGRRRPVRAPRVPHQALGVPAAPDHVFASMILRPSAVGSGNGRQTRLSGCRCCSCCCR